MRTLIVGNGHGIGLALTKRLLGDGNDVMGVLRHFLDPICDRHTQHVLDALDPGFPESIAKIVAEKSPIDTLVYCAGIGEPFETAGVDRDGDTISGESCRIGRCRARRAPKHAGAGEWPNYRGLQHRRPGVADRARL